MATIKFSTCKDPHDTVESYEAILAPFARSHNVAVDLDVIPWENARQEIKSMALYGGDTDVSEVGAPDINDLIAMNALRPFTHPEIASFGGAAAFAPVAWNKMSNSK